MRERPRDKARLEHIINACDIVADAIKKYGFEHMLQDPILYYGLVKHVEIIGEAIYMLSKDFKKQHNEVAWQEIEDLRHILVHDYYKINPNLLRPIVEEDIPKLQPIIKKLYEKESSL